MFRQQASCFAQDAHEAGRPIPSAPTNGAVMSWERTNHIPHDRGGTFGGVVRPVTCTQQINTTQVIFTKSLEDSRLHSKYITYGPHKAVAEVSNHNEPIGRKSGIQLLRKIRKSMGFTFSCFDLN